MSWMCAMAACLAGLDGKVDVNGWMGFGVYISACTNLSQFLTSRYHLHCCRVHLIRKLTLGMPLPYSYTNLMGEVMFSQLLCLPKPKLQPMSYSTVMVELCKVCGAHTALRSTARHFIAHLNTQLVLLSTASNYTAWL